MQQLTFGGIPASQIPQLPRVENISCVLPPTAGKGGLYLGNYFGTQNIENLKDYGIRAILTTSIETPVSYNPEDIPFHKRIAAHDKQNFSITEYLQDCIDFIDEFRAITNVYVHCYAGMSRSTTIVVAYLMKLFRWGYEATIHFVKFKRIIANPNEGFTAQLKTYEKTLGIVPKAGFPPMEVNKQPVQQATRQVVQSELPARNQQPQVAPQQFQQGQQGRQEQPSQPQKRVVFALPGQQPSNANIRPSNTDNRMPPMVSPRYQMGNPRPQQIQSVGSEQPQQFTERVQQPPVRRMHDQIPIPKFGSKNQTANQYVQPPPQAQQTPLAQPKKELAKEDKSLKGSKAGFIRPKDLPGYRAS